MAAAALVSVLAAALPAVACEPLPQSELVAVASHRSVTQVVERRVLAANPLPWGRSAAVVTRVWGPGTVERWVTTGRRSEACPELAPLAEGTTLYSFPGSGQPEVAAEQPAAGLDATALETRFGQPKTYPVSDLDRMLAWVLVAPSWFIGGAVAVVGAAWGVMVWRRRRRDQYLF